MLLPCAIIIITQVLQIIIANAPGSEVLKSNDAIEPVTFDLFVNNVLEAFECSYDLHHHVPQGQCSALKPATGRLRNGILSFPVPPSASGTPRLQRAPQCPSDSNQPFSAAS
jgi:hypothetical protein